MIWRAVLFIGALVFLAAQTPSVSHFAIIYSPSEGVTRRIINPDNDWELNDPKLLMPGEAIMVLSKDQITGDKRVANGRIQAATGRAPTDDRCLFVDSTNTVVAVHLCDPSIDKPPSGTTFAAVHADANKGDKWDGANFNRLGKVLK